MKYRGFNPSEEVVLVLVINIIIHSRDRGKRHDVAAVYRGNHESIAGFQCEFQFMSQSTRLKYPRVLVTS